MYWHIVVRIAAACEASSTRLPQGLLSARDWTGEESSRRKPEQLTRHTKLVCACQSIRDPLYEHVDQVNHAR